MNLVQDRNKCCAVVNTVTNFRVAKNARNIFLRNCQLLRKVSFLHSEVADSCLLDVTSNVLDFKLSPCSVCCVLSFG